MSRDVATAIAMLISVSTYGIWARDHNDHRAPTASDLSDVSSCSVSSANHVPSRDAITIRHIRFEGAPPFQDSSSVILRFDIRNDSADDVKGIIVSVSLFSSADLAPENSPLLRQPLRVLVNEPLPAGYSLDYRIRLKNLSLESACRSKVVIVGDTMRAEPTVV